MAVTVVWEDRQDAVRVRDALLTASAVAAAEGHDGEAHHLADMAMDVAHELVRLPVLARSA